MNTELKKGDTVLVLAGKDKGKTGKITACNRHKGRVTVANVNIVSKHRKPRSQNDKGGIKKEEAPIDISNVQIVCPNCGKSTRIAQKFDEKGIKHRACKKCGAFMDGEKRAKDKPATKDKTSKETVKEAKAEPVTEKTPMRAKKESAKKTAVAKKAKVDTATTKRKTPQAKSTGK